MKKIYIIKANGQSVPFDTNKVIGTCIRAGASNKMAKRIAKKTLKMVRNGIFQNQFYDCKGFANDELKLTIPKNKHPISKVRRITKPSAANFSVIALLIICPTQKPFLQQEPL